MLKMLVSLNYVCNSMSKVLILIRNTNLCQFEPRKHKLEGVPVSIYFGFQDILMVFFRLRETTPLQMCLN